MFKKFLNGMVFGAGFCVALIIVYTIYAEYYLAPLYKSALSLASTSTSSSATGQTVDTPPVLPKKEGYLGQRRFYSPDFKMSESVDLSEGPGLMTGSAHLNGEPLANLKVRLALNGKALSMWAETDSQGQYTIQVPYGEYRIDGFEFDSLIVDSILAGKIAYPTSRFTSGTIVVSEDAQGRGLLFRFVDPIKITIPKNRYSVTEPIKISWSSYPDTDNYIIQILVKDAPYISFRSRILFKGWSNQPMVPGNSFTLDADKHGLKPGLFYLVVVTALKNKNQPISKSVLNHGAYDFEITE